MVRKEELTYKSRDRQTMLHAIRWIPEGKPVAILQIIHGMQEFIGRYDEFANFLAEKGILVMGNDHLGHGGSVADGKGTYGFFCKNDPATVLVRDAHRLKKMTQEEYYRILKEKWEKVDKNNLEEIKRYNEFKRILRYILEDSTP